MSVAWLFILYSFLLLGVPVCSQPGFISINCGIAENSTYLEDTGISYLSDAGFIDTGVNGNVAQASFPLELTNLYSTVRSFPNGTRNCYTLKPMEKGNKYVVRAYFLYGNYDGKDSPPQFDLYLDVNLWKTISFSNASDAFYTDIITVAAKDFISVCLIDTSLGTPFISALEVRLLNKSMYIASNQRQSLLFLERYDLGSDNETGYPDDPFDIVWDPSMDNELWRLISTTHPVATDNNLGFDPPSIIMKTAVKPANDSNPLNIDFSVDNPNWQIHVVMYFAELEQLKPNMTREFQICCGTDPCSDPFRPEYLVTTIFSYASPFSGQSKDNSCWFNKIANSTLPPILNAYETFTVLKLSDTPTKTQEVEAMMDVKATYKVKRNWMGDPCIPKDYLWEGLACNYPDSGSPTIKYMDLSSTGLDGEISLSFASLTSIESLDLSGNKLTGPIPDFLGDLPSLSLLDLSGNQLNGTIPSNLLERSNKRQLKLSVEGNPNLNVSDTRNKQSKSSAPNKKKIVVPIIATVASIMILLILLIIIWTFKRRKQGDPTANSRKTEGELAPNNLYMRNGSVRFENQQFTYTEVVRITNNFERTIGNGGFGTVYHGEVRDGIQVAVKILSLKSVKLLSRPCQGSNEFQNEVQLLTRMHHKNVIPFIGYCKEGDNMALIYEYMAQGNLASHLSSTSSQSLTWSQRLRIALDVAQGLEYLHNYCKPPIIHRDLKATNILLNEKLEAKIGDFGMSKIFIDGQTHVSTAIKGTHGYLDPEYYSCYRLTEKSDVYSFGVVVLQLITGQPAIIQTSNSERINLTAWIRPSVTERNIQGMIDPRLEGDYDVNSVWKAIDIALACILPRSIERPTSSDVVVKLRECLETEIAGKRNRRIKIEQESSSSSFYPSPR